MAQHKLHVRKGDRVKVVAGKDKGTVGEIIAVDPANQRVTVEGVNVVKRHRRETQTQAGRRTEGGIIASEAPIHASNVQLVVKDDEGNEVVTRVGHRRDEVTKRRPDGTEYQGFRSVRIARKTGKEI
ncbi:50S ribosomal protein L24 [Auraticoccus sp. F435]|uniref:Large ribosomal subunit protein uL24 n=1 Tax=Auraticoccus cholistanensis TaxID=2656650 RepID=A0A6A9UVW7_9ACTN|nr:50S ribosomal protein L24 [Auraticoccus cholistanensis]MVA76861.1 50S ribosomal protein L24 [Auraticoccus cholistanensis]